MARNKYSEFEDIFSEFGKSASSGGVNNEGSFQMEEEQEGQTQREYDTYGGERKLKQDTVNIKCTSCGGNLEFDASSGVMRCESCGGSTIIDVDRRFSANEYDPELDQRGSWASETKVFKCDNCGAQTVLDSTEIASECVFCGSPNVVKNNTIEGLKPDIVMPFSYTEEQLRAGLATWLKKKKFAPSDFKKSFDPNKVMGIYSSCFMFDARTDSYYSARVGKYYTVTVGRGENRRTERRIRWYNVRGDYSDEFQNVFVEASPHFTQKIMNKLKPFPSDRFVSYDKRFLLGYRADHYDKGLQACWSDAKQTIDKSITSSVRKVLYTRADVIGELKINTRYHDKKYKLGLIPVYVGNYKYKDKVYNIFANGVTGKLVAGAPVSGFKIFLLVAGIVAGLLLLMGLANLLQHFGILTESTVGLLRAAGV